jgi:hypothetical protein
LSTAAEDTALTAVNAVPAPRFSAAQVVAALKKAAAEVDLDQATVTRLVTPLLLELMLQEPERSLAKLRYELKIKDLAPRRKRRR